MTPTTPDIDRLRAAISKSKYSSNPDVWLAMIVQVETELPAILDRLTALEAENKRLKGSISQIQDAMDNAPRNKRLVTIDAVLEQAVAVLAATEAASEG